MDKINSIFYMYSNMDKSSQLLIFLIVLVSLMLLSIAIINTITKKKHVDVEEKKFIKIEDIEEDFSDTLFMQKEEEIETLDEEIETIEVVEEKKSIEELEKLLEASNEIKPIDLTKFEIDQEKDAIISYDELVKRAGAKKIVYKTEEKKKEDKVEIDNQSRFKASDIVSPIYGVQKQKVNRDDDYVNFDEPKRDSNLDDEMTRDLEFLTKLKTFRSELD